MPDETKQPRSGRSTRSLQAERLRAASPFKRQVYYALESITEGSIAAKICGTALFVLIIANAALVFILVQFDFDMDFWVQLFYGVSTICFLIEYLLRMWIADLVYPAYQGPWARLRYGRSIFGIIDLLAFLPNIIAWFIPTSGLLVRLINVMRLIRLIKVSRYMRGLRTIGKVISKSRSEIVAAFLVIILLVVVCSVLMYEVENPVQPEVFDSLLTGVYWAVTTITATGYGDVVPLTFLGRVIGFITMLLSVCIVAIPGGILSAGFVAEYQNSVKRRHGQEVEQGEYFEDDEDLP